MDDIRKLDTKIRNKEAELHALYTKIQKLLGGRDCDITPQEIGCEKTGNCRDVINRGPKCDL